MTDWALSDFEAAIDFRSSLNHESDRGCALMAAAYLDDRLAALLKSYFVDDSKVADELLGQSGPLGTFSARIDVAYSIGLLSHVERRALHLIRKIRNDFGHVPEPLSFTTQTIAEKCKHLESMSFVKRSTHKAMFTGAVMAVLAALNVRQRAAHHRDRRKDVKITKEDNPLDENHRFNSFMQAVATYLSAMNAGPEAETDAIEKLRYVIAEMVVDDPTTAARESQEMVDKLTAHIAEKLKT
jgi:DNA-binding MltR family transcriptional regulator